MINNINEKLKTRTGQKHVEAVLLGFFAIVAVLFMGLSFVGIQNKPAEITAIELKANPFHDIKILAKSAYVIDVNTGKVLYEKNADVQLPLASLTKLITAVTAIELVPDYTIVSIDEESIKNDGDSGLVPDEKFKLKDLINLVLVSSSNDGASALAASVGAIETGKMSDSKNYMANETVFVKKMNEKIHALNLNQTFVLNSTGLDTSSSLSGGYGSAKDVGTLFTYILKNRPDLISSTQKANFELSSEDFKHTAKNTNTDVNNIPELLGSKTGYTDLAGGNLVIAFDAGFNKPIIISVLGSTEEGRFEDVNKLVWTSLEYLKEQN